MNLQLFVYKHYLCNKYLNKTVYVILMEYFVYKQTSSGLQLFVCKRVAGYPHMIPINEKNI